MSCTVRKKKMYTRRKIVTGFWIEGGYVVPPQAKGSQKTSYITGSDNGKSFICKKCLRGMIRN